MAVADAGPATWRKSPQPRFWLGLVCAVHALAALLLIGPHFWYEWDETVYISQVSRQAPAGLFTAPRARGLTFLVAPVTELTTSTVALRIYLAVLSSVLMYAAFRPWLRLRSGAAVPLAAALFTTLWTSIYYGFEAMPNFYVAVGAVATVAYFLLTVQGEADRRHLWLLVGWVTFVALMRPSDAAYLIAPLVVIALLHRSAARRQRAFVVVALFAGAALGSAEWAIEAYTSYGGLLHRLHSASAENDSGLHMSLGLEARAAGGPTLCRPCTRAIAPAAFAWWFLVPPLAAIGLVTLRRQRQALVGWAPALAALSLLAEYLVTIDYAAPRFLIPTYALAALPVAEGALALVRMRSLWTPRVAVPTLVGLLLVHTAVQLAILEQSIVRVQTQARLQYLTVAASLRAAQVARPCDIVGYYAAPIAFAVGCTDTPTISHRTAVERLVNRPGYEVIVLTTAPAASDTFYAGWQRVTVHGPHLRHAWFAYVHAPARRALLNRSH
ncbi:MAG TPA: hypothetical protein VFH54_10610 [Mycobacteriales bacterium]|nr:hypothetical protein [Mycobacteriales bacterium]